MGPRRRMRSEDHAAEVARVANAIAEGLSGSDGATAIDALCSTLALAIALHAETREQAHELGVVACASIGQAVGRNWLNFNGPGASKAN